ncbi:hypothetical protein L1S34_06790 [Flavobacterium sp. K77]|uniref:hypothetical protein n=1 Tax=Flavobacterium sp. K77 TaxID=2910676 RepID=UPI001F41D521|nr:hypothetical protein [Flavobacterium sp. K77]MCF6140986.1 hypothetical protein [Flavobacterium sp. K77]
MKHYWVLHQYNKDKYLMIVGEVYLPNYTIDINKNINKKTILNRLSEIDAFDKILVFKNKDVLEIVLNNDQNDCPLKYYFQFKNGSWKNKKYSSFGLESEYDDKEKGKIKNPIKR